MQTPSAPLRREVNFGGNQSWHSRRLRPASEAEVLDLLDRRQGDRIRALGSNHSWSDIAAGADVCIELSRITSVEPFVKDGGRFVRVGAGCTLQKLLDKLHAATDQTLPTLGAITKQTIAGAISTGTHGSGLQSLSHFVANVRIAAYDAAGRAAIHEYQSGDELKAARCGLGCMGIILSVDLRTVPKYKVAETVRNHQNVNDILLVYREHPLTQFIYTPYGWKWVAFERKAVGTPPSTPMALVKSRGFRIFQLAGLDILFHLGILASRLAGSWAIKRFLSGAHHLTYQATGTRRRCRACSDGETPLLLPRGNGAIRGRIELGRCSGDVTQRDGAVCRERQGSPHSHRAAAACRRSLRRASRASRPVCSTLPVLLSPRTARGDARLHGGIDDGAELLHLDLHLRSTRSTQPVPTDSAHSSRAP